MARPRAHLTNAPIAEAIIDFRISGREEISPDTFANLEGFIGEQYAGKSPISLLQGFFGIDNGRPLGPSQSQTELGWRYQTQHEFAQFRVDGFTFSKIEPYTTWEDVFGEAFRLWSIYWQLAQPRQVTRVAVRFINRMRITGSAEIGRYLEAPPVLPPPIPQNVRDFLTRVYVDDRERNVSAVIVQALEPRIDPNTLSILLDIDAFREVNALSNDPSLPETFERLRQLKNEIFYASITELTAEMYE